MSSFRALVEHMNGPIGITLPHQTMGAVYNIEFKGIDMKKKKGRPGKKGKC